MFVCLCVTCELCLLGPEEGARSSVTGVAGGYESLIGGWEPNLGAPQ